MSNLKAISGYDRYLFHEGRHFRSYRMLGAQQGERAGVKGVRFAVWAPNAREVMVVGDFNGWSGEDKMRRLKSSGIWELFVPGLEPGALYKYQIVSAAGDVREKADPYAFWAEVRPLSASRVFGLDGYRWGDSQWQGGERLTGGVNKPMAIYEVHLGSWRRKTDGSFYSYRELADELSDYAADMGFTHLELLPVAEHPFDASWGYQATGYYAPTSRYGSPDDFKYFVDRCHQKGLGVILDWVPGHFCKDDHGLRMFDGSPLFESGWPARAENQGWGTLNFDFGKPEVWSFLISNAMYWFDIFHIDGLRVDAVANMIYLDYGRQEGGEWLPNEHGGRENLDAIAFLKKLNEAVHYYYPRALVIAEESTAWPLVSRPVYLGGLGFDYKWNMGWMNDTLRYVSLDPIHRQWEHRLLTFSLLYAFSENFLLPLSHDEVVHGKKSLLDKMPGDYWQKFANLRAFFGYFMAHPGKKLLFMGGEFGQFSEWYEGRGLDWLLLEYELHSKLHGFTRELVRFYRDDSCLWENDDNWRGFEWIDCHDSRQSVISFLRRADNDEHTVVVTNFTPVVRHGYRIGVPEAGSYREVLNSDRAEFGGSGVTNDELRAEPQAWHSQPFSVVLTVPPLATVYIKREAMREE
ncbi:1,4-alpha-glucan branching protein GlgB [Anaeroselena agilis]|uniref:1,4-alpha-glucan branching enzyme GlgB n=1 Tax=Anaeroselena agilis TaxID=3063788 RepID=A0ABU3P4L1_9FIRM|nr:1,4-alpha-glucan branching protein GlgB [Selenomonadales bacterium 4137-cl]